MADDDPVDPVDESPTASGPDPAAGPGIAGTGVDAALLEALLPHMAESLMVLDREWNVLANLAPPGGLIGRGLGIGVHTLEDMHPDDALQIMDLGAQAFLTEPGWEGSMVVRMQRGDGTYGRYEVTATNRLDDPVVAGMVVRTREVVGESPPDTPGLENRLAAELAELLPTGVVVLEGSGRPIYANGAACGILRREPEELKRAGLLEAVSDDDRDRLAGAVERVRSVEGREACTVRIDGGRRVVECQLSSFGEPTVTAVIITLDDVTARHHAEARLAHRANHDDLTGLRNRASVLDILRERVDGRVPTVVAYIDLDGFKDVNDDGGHAAGDRLLTAVGRALRDGLPDAVVGRIGGDEFVVVADEAAADELCVAVETIVAAAGRAHGAVVGCSVGLAWLDDDDEPRAVLHRADEAMYRHKRVRRARAG